MSAESKVAAPVGGVDVLRAEVDARTIFDIADIRAGYDNATREDVEFKAIALRNFNAIAAVAEMVEAAKLAKRAYWLARNSAAGLTNYCEESASTRRCERELSEAETLWRAAGLDAALAPFQAGGAE